MYFHTATICNWKPLLADENAKLIIIQSLQWLVENNQVYVHGFVIMPNHVHFLWSPPSDMEIKSVANRFASFTGSELRNYLYKFHPEKVSMYLSSQTDRVLQLWERRPRSIRILSRDIAEQKLDYIHNNPVQEKWSLCSFPEEYLYSSASYYLKGGAPFGFLTHYADFC